MINCFNTYPYSFVVIIDDYVCFCLGVATVSMSRKPVNSLNLDMLSDMSSALDQLHADKACKGLVLTSVCKMGLVNGAGNIGCKIRVWENRVVGKHDLAFPFRC